MKEVLEVFAGIGERRVEEGLKELKLYRATLVNGNMEVTICPSSKSSFAGSGY